jgi:hypothetical protein
VDVQTGRTQKVDGVDARLDGSVDGGGIVDVLPEVKERG